jgi:D-sedoheptulose 7-phosphate isomerase
MNYIETVQQVLSRIDPSPLIAFVEGCQGTLWLAGNGGSASCAAHWACDLSKAAKRRAQVLGSNSAILTAYANDDHYSAALARELERLVRPDDRLLCLSCSGTSPNIVTALRQAWLLKLPCGIVTGKRSIWPTPVSVCVNVPHAHYGILEDCFSVLGHLLTEALCSR